MDRRVLGVLLIVAAAMLAFPVGAMGESPRPTETELPSGGPSDWKLYAEALEFLAAGDDASAIARFRTLAENWPDSLLAPRALEYLSYLDSRLDRSGIVGFYLGTMATVTYAAYSIPAMLDVESDSVLNGLYGLSGVGAGLGASWLLSRDRSWTLGQEVWTELVQAASLGNLELAWAAWIDDLFPDADYGTLTRANLALSTAVALGTRGAAYWSLRDRRPSSGRAVLAASAYGWANFYTISTTAGLLQLEDFHAILATQMLVPDAALVAAALSWDSLGWSAARVGLVNVGALGGLLAGGFIDMILDGMVPYLDERLSTAVLMVGAAGGTWAGAAWTSRFDRRSVSSSRPDPQLVIAPAASSTGIGLSLIVEL